MTGKAALVLALAMFWTAQATADEPAARITDDPAYTHAQQLVDVGAGRRINLYCIGSGSPTVILEPGLTESSYVWAFVQPEIAKKTRVCAWDRAGLGYSDPQTRPGTSANAVSDLRTLLDKAAIAPPYVMVGQSFGGMNVRLFADLYPSEVVGMVLVDPSHEDQRARYDAISNGGASKSAADFALTLRICLEGTMRGFAPGSDFIKNCIDKPNPRFGPNINEAVADMERKVAFQAAFLSEWDNFQTVSSDELRAARRSYGAMPLIVLTAPIPAPPDLPDESKAAFEKAWPDMHDEIAALSSVGVNRIYPGAHHDMQIEEPDLVVKAIDDVLAMVNRSRPNRGQ